jgi:hypothetical protein
MVIGPATRTSRRSTPRYARIGSGSARAELLEHVRLDMLPPPFIDVLDAARAAGLSADVHHGGYRIHLPDGPPVDVDVRDLQPNIEELAVHSVLERLAPFGLRSRITSRGVRVPADDPE